MNASNFFHHIDPSIRHVLDGDKDEEVADKDLFERWKKEAVREIWTMYVMFFPHVEKRKEKRCIFLRERFVHVKRGYEERAGIITAGI